MSILEQLERDLHAAAERRLAGHDNRAASGRHESAYDRQPRRAYQRRTTLAALSLLGAALVAAALLGSRSSGPSLNVAAAAYAATSAPSGIVEATFVTHVYRGVDAGATLRQREWVQGATGNRRELNTLNEPGLRDGATQTTDWVFAPTRWEVWTASAETQVVHRTLWTNQGHVPNAHPGFAGIGLYGIEGIDLYRQLYREGAMRLRGHERFEGRELWKLESHPVGLNRDDHTRLVVLVDPDTFLPISVRQIDVRQPGHPTTVESDLLNYRVLPASATNQKLFNLPAQHPGTHVATHVSNGPFFRDLPPRPHLR